MSGLFAQYQPAYAEYGVSTIPCSSDFKQPMVRNYLNIGIGGSKALAGKFTTSNAIGIVTGRRNSLTVLDIDTTDQRALDDALSRHGDARIVVRTASGKFHAYYRHNGERRRIRPWPERPIDILGERGFVMAPPSLYGSGQYEIIHGTLDNLANLTTMREVNVAKTGERKSEPPTDEGRRNNDLWRHCMIRARSCNTRDELIDIARRENEMYTPPLEQAEVIKVAHSAWAYMETGQNRFGQHGAWIATDELERFLADQDALLLLTFLLAHNGPEATFMCTNSLADRFGWTVKRVAAARSRLIELGRITPVRSAGRGHPALFRWRTRSEKGGAERKGIDRG